MTSNWLFIRGMVREQRHWDEFPKIFKDLHKSCSIHYIDLPGIGNNTQIKSPITVSQIVSIVRSQWLSLKSKNQGNWNVLGVSLGGMVSLQWLIEHPEDFASGVIINSSAALLSLPHKRIQPGSIKAFLPLSISQNKTQWEQAIIKQTISPYTSTDRLLKNWSQFAPEPKFTRALALRQLAAAGTFFPKGNISVPLLFLAAKGDKLAHWTCSQKLNKKLGGTLKLHPWGGHDLPIDDPSWCANQILSWEQSRQNQHSKIMDIESNNRRSI